MKILLLGYGKEGQAAEKYFSKHLDDAEFEIWQDFDVSEIRQRDYSSYDIILRSPSVPPLGIANESSLTKYFFEHCPCPIIGVTATKGKGTICSFAKSLLDALGEDAYLVGNIGTPAIEVLDQLTADSIVVYEMSSFQLWDLGKSPHIAVVGQIEPDHLNVHKNFDDYISAKANICRHQAPNDYLIYYRENHDTNRIADTSPVDAIGHKISYPFDLPSDIVDAIKLPGQHNIENAMAAIAAVASYKNLPVDEFLDKYSEKIKNGLSNFKGLPHRLEFLDEINGVRYYDDNFSTTPSSTRVAIDAFPDDNLTVIIGGRDKTDYQDLPEIYEILARPQVKNIVLIGELGRKLADTYQDNRFNLADSLESSINIAKGLAEKDDNSIILMSPSAASFDMFENVYDRGDQFKKLVSLLNSK